MTISKFIKLVSLSWLALPCLQLLQIGQSISLTKDKQKRCRLSFHGLKNWKLIFWTPFSFITAISLCFLHCQQLRRQTVYLYESCTDCIDILKFFECKSWRWLLPMLFLPFHLLNSINWKFPLFAICRLKITGYIFVMVLSYGASCLVTCLPLSSHV